MKNLKLILPSLLILFVTNAYEYKNIIQISIPKTGTHLLRKCIQLLTQIEVTSTPPNYIHPSNLYSVSPQQLQEVTTKIFWITHLMYNATYIEGLSSKNHALFFLYRDPRDQLISFAFYIKKKDYWNSTVQNLSFDTLLTSLITDWKVSKNHPPAQNIADLYQRYLPWMNFPGMQCIRFENLIGPKGGGSYEKQLATIKQIAHHIGIKTSDKKIKEVANSLFGGTASTFRKGQIGNWKKHFKANHKKAFKEIAGQLLIDLGYEKDFNW